MAASCKGTCERYRALKPIDGKRYAIGQKRCTTCSIFVYWDGVFCPCCGLRLRYNPAPAKYRKMLQILRQS